MLSTSPLDLILILSPSELHVPQALLCLKHGKHIFIEKPLANTLSEVDALEKARAESGMNVFVGYMRRYAAAVDLVKERLEGKGIKYVRVRELIGSVSLFPTSLRLIMGQRFHDEGTEWRSCPCSFPSLNNANPD
jgi:predicted dehydrogenase